MAESASRADRNSTRDGDLRGSGALRRMTPLSDDWGYDRGTPVDRYYIERFLSEHRERIGGRVLEVKDSGYTERFGVGVTQADVLDIDRSNPLATFVADLAAADTIPDATFDCFILTQTLQYVYDVRAAVRHAHRILKPRGTLLATVPVTSRVVQELSDCWRFTPHACETLFGDVFGTDALTVRGYGNVLTSIAFLTGLAHEELTRGELETMDERFPLLVTVAAVKQ